MTANQALKQVIKIKNKLNIKKARLKIRAFWLFKLN